MNLGIEEHLVKKLSIELVFNSVYRECLYDGAIDQFDFLTVAFCYLFSVCLSQLQHNGLGTVKR